MEDQYPHLDKAPGDIRLKVDISADLALTMSLLLYAKAKFLRLWFDGRRSYRTDESALRRMPRTSGYVTLDGHEVVTRSPRMAWQTALCISPKTVNVTVYVGHVSKREHVADSAALLQPPGGSLKHADEQQAVSDFIRLSM